MATDDAMQSTRWLSAVRVKETVGVNTRTLLVCVLFVLKEVAMSDRWACRGMV